MRPFTRRIVSEQAIHENCENWSETLTFGVNLTTEVLSGRGERIRTSDHFTPSEVRYQAALRPEGKIIADKKSRAKMTRQNIIGFHRCVLLFGPRLININLSGGQEKVVIHHYNLTDESVWFPFRAVPTLTLIKLHHPTNATYVDCIFCRKLSFQ